MIEERALLERFHLRPSAYHILKNVKIIDTNDGKFVLKRKYKEKKELYAYLKSRGFPYYCESFETDEKSEYELFPYLEDITSPKEQKAQDIIYLMSLLHNKTCYYRETDLNQVKKFYEETRERIQYLFQYYDDLTNVILKYVYLSPSEYLLVRNLSFLFDNLYGASTMLEKWYEIMSHKKKERVAMVHHNLSLDHFRKQDVGYFISWDRASIDIPIYDFFSFFELNDFSFDYIALFDYYQSRFPLLEEERLQLFCLLLIPKKIVLKKEEQIATQEIDQVLRKLKKAKDLVLKENQKNSQKQ